MGPLDWSISVTKGNQQGGVVNDWSEAQGGLMNWDQDSDQREG